MKRTEHAFSCAHGDVGTYTKATRDVGCDARVVVGADVAPRRADAAALVFGLGWQSRGGRMYCPEHKEES